jgi:hypothetical protein
MIEVIQLIPKSKSISKVQGRLSSSELDIILHHILTFLLIGARPGQGSLLTQENALADGIETINSTSAIVVVEFRLLFGL